MYVLPMILEMKSIDIRYNTASVYCTGAYHIVQRELRYHNFNICKNYSIPRHHHKA